MIKLIETFVIKEESTISLKLSNEELNSVLNVLNVYDDKTRYDFSVTPSGRGSSRTHLGFFGDAPIDYYNKSNDKKYAYVKRLHSKMKRKVEEAIDTGILVLSRDEVSWLGNFTLHLDDRNVTMKDLENTMDVVNTFSKGYGRSPK